MRTVHAGTIRDYGPSRVGGDDATSGRRSDAACFADRANMGNDSFKPECAQCLKPAIGGILREMDGVDSITIEFRCAACGPSPHGYVVMTANLQTWGVKDTIMKWVPVAIVSPGVHRMRKLG
jgi:hypothetical protein